MAQATKRSTNIARRTDHPMAIGQPIGAPKLELDMKVTTDDLVNVALSEAEEALSLEREATERRLHAASKRYQESVSLLQTQATKLVDATAADPEAAQLALLLSSFTGKRHTVVMVAVDTDSYSYSYKRKEKKDYSPEVNVDKGKVIGEIRLLDPDQSEVVSKQKEIPFTDEMQSTVGVIEKQAAEVQSVQDALMTISRKIIDLPRMKNRARAELTKAALRGQLTDTRKVLETVLGTENKALPPIDGSLVVLG